MGGSLPRPGRLPGQRIGPAARHRGRIGLTRLGGFRQVALDQPPVPYRQEAARERALAPRVVAGGALDVHVSGLEIYRTYPRLEAGRGSLRVADAGGDVRLRLLRVVRRPRKSAA